jgi:hypothetical protein
MVNSESSTFKLFEKIGYVIGRVIRVFLMGSLVTFLGGKLVNSKALQAQTEPQVQLPPP